MSLDLTFITNEPGQTLKERFETLIKDARTLDCLVGYFYTTGFHLIYKSLENTNKIRILVGIGISKKTYDLLQTASQENQQLFQNSHAETKQNYGEMIEKEMEDSEDVPIYGKLKKPRNKRGYQND